MKEKYAKSYKNGNYKVTIFSDGTKIRNTDEDKFIPEFAECIDLKITSVCNGGCPYCYEGCNKDGVHGELLNNSWVDSLHPYTEVAINGNDLTHPQLFPFLFKLKRNNVIVNMTVNQMHFDENFLLIKDMVDSGLVKGVGISLLAPTKDFIAKVNKIPNAVIHVIAGVVSEDQLKSLENKDIKLLVLGFKSLKRGIDYKKNHDVEKEMEFLNPYIKANLGKFNVISFDNLALKQLNVKSIAEELGFNWKQIFMGEDGGFTFYLDAVENKFSISSTKKEDSYSAQGLTVKEMFDIVAKKASENKITIKSNKQNYDDESW